MNKYYTITSTYRAGRGTHYVNIFDEKLNHTAKLINPPNSKIATLTHIYKQGDIALDFHDYNVIIGQKNGYKYFLLGERIDGVTTSAAKKMYV